MWRGCVEKGTTLHCWWECKLIQPLWKTLWKFLKKLGIKPPYDPEIPLLCIYPEETETEKDSWTLMFTAALFTIARTQKQPKCPLADEWIKKLWYIYKGLLVSYKKECIWVSFNKVDEPKAYYTEWASQIETSIIYYINIYTWNLERWNWWSYLQGSFPGDAAGKESACQCRKYEAGLILVGEDPLE